MLAGPNREADVQAVIVYDGACGFCQKQIRRIQGRDAEGRFEYLPKQDPSLAGRFPQLADGDFSTGMRLVQPDGSVLVGADAVHGIGRQLSPYKYVAWIYRVPVIHGLCRFAYAWIARNRQRLSGSCETGACPLPSKATDPPP